MTEPIDLLITICSHRTISVPTVISLDKLRYDFNLKWGLVIQQGDALISRARSMACTHFLDDVKIPFMLFIDDDILFDPPDVHRIYNSLINGYDVIGGIYPVRGAYQLASYGWGGTLPVDDQIRDVEFLATGFMGISRRILERVRDELKLPLLNPNDWSKCYPFFEDGRVLSEQRVRGGDPIYISEDWDFPLCSTTPVLLNDFSWKQLGDISIGDTLIGFEDKPASFHPYQETIVTEEQDGMLEALRIITEKGEIVASTKHPLFAESPSTSAARWICADRLRIGQRLKLPILKTTNPVINQDYMEGYLKGLWDGDGSIDRYGYAVLEMTDYEAVDRARRYAISLGLIRDATISKRNLPSPRWKPLYKLYCGSALLSIKQMKITGESMARGFLAGIYDAEGSFSYGHIRIAGRDVKIKDNIVFSVSLLGVDGAWSIRQDGLWEWTVSKQKECFQFFQKVQPAISRKVSLSGKGQGLNRAAIFQSQHPRILAIEKLGRRELRCLTTTSGNFIANGFASHNCQKVREIGGRVFADCGVQVGHMREQLYLPKHVLQVQGQQQAEDRVFSSIRKQQELILSVDTDLSEFLHEPLTEVQRMMGKESQQALATKWQEKTGTADEFYQNNKTYLYDLAAHNRLPSYYQARVNGLLNIFGQKILDIGCGIGTAVFMLAGQGNNVLGWDINSQCIDFCEFKKQKYNLDGEFTIEKPDFSQFDIITAVDMLEHIEDLRGFLLELGQTMKTGARLYHSDYFPKDKTWPMHFEEHAPYLNDWLKEAGLAIWDSNWAVKL